MATTTKPNHDETSPPNYEPVELTGLGDRRWVHRETGLAVDIYRYARQHSPVSMGTPDWYEYQLVIRPDGPDGQGYKIDTTDTPEYAVPMAAQWMREHPGGLFDGGED